MDQVILVTANYLIKKIKAKMKIEGIQAYVSYQECAVGNVEWLEINMMSFDGDDSKRMLISYQDSIGWGDCNGNAICLIDDYELTKHINNMIDEIVYEAKIITVSSAISSIITKIGLESSHHLSRSKSLFCPLKAIDDSSLCAGIFVVSGNNHTMPARGEIYVYLSDIIIMRGNALISSLVLNDIDLHYTNLIANAAVSFFLENEFGDYKI